MPAESVTDLDEARAEFLALVSGLIAGWDAETAAMPHARIIENYPELTGVAFHDQAVASPHGSVPMRAYSPSSTPRSTFMWIHGGAFVTGNLDMPEAHWVSLTLAAAGHRVVSVDYRKALDGIHYPVPIDDVHTAWGWTVDQQWVGPLRLGGGSAGGAYAAALAVRLRDSGERQPDAVALVYPIVHPRLPAMSEELDAATAVLPVREHFTPRIIEGMMYNFAGTREALADPHAFAGLADCAGLPPTFVLTSEYDVLRASGERYVKQLQDAGVDVETTTEMGSHHGQLNEPLEPTGIRSLQRLIDWLDRHAG